jgi:hypothetical protein
MRGGPASVLSAAIGGSVGNATSDSAVSTGITRDQIFSILGYSPTPEQLKILDDTHSTQLVAGGYRGGKSRTASIKGLLATLEFIARYRERAAGQVAWLVAADYEATRAEFMHPDGSLTLDLQRLWPKVDFSSRVDPGEIRVPVPSADGRQAVGNFTIRTKSAFDPTSLGMESPVWTILCEAARVSQDVYHRLRSRCSEARRRFPEFGWLYMEGTFEGSLGWYPTLWTRWQSPAIQEREDARSFSLPSHSNTVLFPGGIDDPQITALRNLLPEPKFLERHMGVPVPPSGRVHASFSSDIHVRQVKYDPAEPVFIGIDPGYSGQPSTYAVEVCQQKRFENGHWQWQVVDEIAMNRHSMPGFTVADVCDLAMNRPWWQNPQKTGVIDIAGTAHAGAQESNAEVWRKRTGMVFMHEKVSILPGIDRFDTCLKLDEETSEPGLVIDPTCELLISELGGGPNPFDGQSHVYRWGTDRSGDVVGRVPRDEYCDGIKALTYLFVHVMGYAGQARSDTGRSSKITVRSRRR